MGVRKRGFKESQSPFLRYHATQELVQDYSSLDMVFKAPNPGLIGSESAVD